MKLFKKSLCIALSLLMMFSAFAFSASAVTGAENAAKTNIKYEVEQVKEACGYTAVNNDIYAVSVYAKCQYGIASLQMPIHFDKTKFAPIMWADPDPINDYAYGYDGWYLDQGEGKVYSDAYVTPDSYNDTSMYNAAGALVTAKGPARYVGLGVPAPNNPVAPEYNVNFYDNENPAYASWIEGLNPDTTGVCEIFIANNRNTKNAYLNSFDNKVLNDWVRMTTMYFIRLPGVSEADALGAEFGCYSETAFGQKDLADLSGKPSYFTTTYNEGKPGINVVSNAKVENKVQLNFWKTQIRFQKNGAAYADAFDYRFLATIPQANFNTVFGSEDAAKTAIKEVGFVFADNANIHGFNRVAAEALVKSTLGTAEANDGTYVKKTVSFLQQPSANNGNNYVFSCMVEGNTNDDAANDANITAYSYVAYDIGNGVQYAFFDASRSAGVESTFNSQFTGNWETAFGTGTALPF